MADRVSKGVLSSHWHSRTSRVVNFTLLCVIINQYVLKCHFFNPETCPTQHSLGRGFKEAREHTPGRGQQVQDLLECRNRIPMTVLISGKLPRNSLSEKPSQ